MPNTVLKQFPIFIEFLFILKLTRLNFNFSNNNSNKTMKPQTYFSSNVL